MSSIATVPGVMSYLRAALMARAGMQGVQVATGPMGSETAKESLQFYNVDASQRDRTAGSPPAPRREERYTIDGAIWTEARGIDEDAILAARERCYAILAELEGLLNSDRRLGNRVQNCRLNTYRLDQGIDLDAASRFAQISFGIEVTASLL